MVLLGCGLRNVFCASPWKDCKCEAAPLIDLEKDVGNVVMEAAIENQHNIDAGGLTEETLLGECVRLQFSLLHGSDLQLVLQGRSIEWRQVKVG